MFDNIITQLMEVYIP